MFRGNALSDLGRTEEALASYDRGLARNPNDAPALTNRGNVLSRLGRYEEALASYDRALSLMPQSLDVLINRGTALHELKRLEEAIANYRQALRLKPDSVQAWNNIGLALHELGRFDEALSTYDKVVNLDPKFAEGHSNRGMTLEALGWADEAEREYDRALALKPDLPNAQWNKFLKVMSRGRLEEGWALWESRWFVRIPDWKPPTRRSYSAPLWNGRRVRGALIVWGEQGLGDQVIHASMAVELRHLADSVIVEVEPRLVQLFSRSFAGVEVRPLAARLSPDPVAAHTSIASIGRHLRPTMAAFAGKRRAYLAADRARVSRLRERLAGGGEPLIGLSWRSVNPLIGVAKSAQLRDLAGMLGGSGYRFIDLQYGDTAADRSAVERELGIAVEHVDDIDNTNDIDGLAALISACDAVVTVSNTTAHLAGALGRPTWVMVPSGHARLWYWFKDMPDSPWYPRVRVWPQGSTQSWADLVASLTPEVEAAIGQRS